MLSNFLIQVHLLKHQKLVDMAKQADQAGWVTTQNGLESKQVILVAGQIIRIGWGDLPTFLFIYVYDNF